MSEPFLAEIRILPYRFAPENWAACDGQILPIAQNPALYSLIGTYYGGDGRVTMGLPNLKGSVPIGSGHAPGFSQFSLGKSGGASGIALDESEIPSHSHLAKSERHPSETTSPAGALFAFLPEMAYWSSEVTGLVQSPSEALSVAGGSVSHQNMQPFLSMQFCICLDGDYPSRS